MTPIGVKPMPDDLASTLDEVRGRYAHGAKITATGRDVCASADDVPRLAAAVEAVLKVADEWEQDRYKGTSTLEWIHQRCAERLREAVTRELTGKEGGDRG
jgi:hypothetical protein